MGTVRSVKAWRAKQLRAGVCALVATSAVIAAPAAAAAAPRCTGVSAPTATTAWRAYVPALTPVRPRPSSAVARARVTTAGAWRLVVGVARAGGGRCLLEVRLAQRPNTAHGWVSGDRVQVRRTRWRIEISRAARVVTLRHAGRAVGRWPVVVGTPSTPTPPGLFAIQATYRSSPGSFYGTWILALTAHSQVLTTFGGGDGRVALHGRGGASLADPLGTAASHGCVRFDNDAIDAIVRRVGWAHLPGVPVAIS